LGQVVETADLAMLGRVEGRQPDGLLGYEFTKRFVTMIDYQNGRLTFQRPGARTEPPAQAIAVPFHFNEHIPEIDGRIDGLPGRFLIDTGSRGGLALFAPFTERHRLIARYHAHVAAITGWGLAGPTRALLAPGRLLRLGPVDAPAAPLELALPQRGALASRYEAGTVGGRVLRQFNLTLDYGRQVIWFQRNAAWGRDEPFDRSGLWLNREADDIVIADVVPGGAGALAGLRGGDHLRRVDGRPIQRWGLPELRQRLKAPPGTRIAVTIARCGTESDAIITLAELR
jgi:hypothetical protein